MPPDPATTATEPASECCAKCPHVHHLGIGCRRCIVAALDAHAAAAVAKERERCILFIQSRMWKGPCDDEERHYVEGTDAMLEDLVAAIRAIPAS
jgi:hypothetical protein